MLQDIPLQEYCYYWHFSFVQYTSVEEVVKIEKIFYIEGKNAAYEKILALLLENNEYNAIRVLKQYEEEILSLEDFYE